MSSSDSYSTDSSGESLVFQEISSDVSEEELSGSSSDGDGPAVHGIMPYQFEPQVSRGVENSDESDSTCSEEKRNFLDWQTLSANVLILCFE